MEEEDIVSTKDMIEQAGTRIRVGDTDIGSKLKIQIQNLQRLLEAYREGMVKVQKI